MPYTAPTTEQRFVLETIADLPGLAALPAYANASPDMVDAILAESGRMGRLQQAFHDHAAVAARLPGLEREVRAGTLAASTAARELMTLFLRNPSHG